jgi:outer membrane protein
MLPPLSKKHPRRLVQALQHWKGERPIRPPFLMAALLLAFFSFGTILHAQSPLDEYIREGIVGNLVLKEKKLGLQRGLLGLENAKRLFLPSVNLSGTYTLAAGGRKIDLPVGDLLNPVYATLNQMTQSNSFPQIENESVTFLPNNFYDIKVRTTVPILSSDLIHNRHLQDQNMEMKEAEVEAYRLELVKDIRKAYYQYLMAIEAKSIYEAAHKLVEENVRVNQSLLEHGKGLPAQVMRAKSELENVNAQIQQAEANVQNARAYFNFLLNRAPDATVTAEPMELPADLRQQLVDESRIAHRPELEQLEVAMRMNEEALKMDRQYWVPTVGAFVDLGSQGFNFEVSDNTAYVMGGISLDLPIWNGGRDQTAIALREQGGRELENKMAQAEKGIQLAIHTRRNTTLASYESWKSTLLQVDAAEAYFRVVDKGYAQGTFSLIEHLDARNQTTQARLLANIRKYETFMSWAEYRREIAENFE